MRLFVAMPLPAGTRSDLVHWMRSCGPQPALRWTPEEQLHVTLHFLGEVADERVAAIVQALDEISLHEFPVALDRIDVLGRASVLVAAAKLTAEFSALAEAARSRLGKFTDSHAEPFRSFRPHVTLARANRDITVPKLCSLPALPAIGFRAMCFRLYRSELRKDGAVHTALQEWALRES